MIKFNYYSVSTAIIILLAVSTLIFHIYQLHTFLLTILAQDSEVVLYVSDDTVPVVSNVPKNLNSSTSVLFLGDVMLGRNVEYLSDIHGVGYSTALIAGRLPPADAVVANFESAMAIPHVRTRAYTTQFSTAVTMLPVLTALGVTHVSLANNHTLDFGAQGYQNAVSKLKTVSISPFGHSTAVSSSSVTIIDNKWRIGIIALNKVFVNPNMKQVQAQMESLTDTTDVQVAYIHWGEEYVGVHNAVQENFARELVEIGVDVIIGHHPHVVQDIGVVDGVPVFYSLGNFIFDQYFSTEVQEGYALLMTVEQFDQLAFSIIPVTSVDSRSQPRKMTTEETDVFLEGLAARSNETLKDAILANNLSFATNLAQEEEISMITQ